MTSRSTWGSVAASALCGQAIIVTLVLQYIGTNYLHTTGTVLATFQTSLAFLVLAITCLPFVLSRPQIHRPWWLWLLLGFAHVEGHFCAIKAFGTNPNYSFMGILLHLAIPFQMLLAYLILRTRYSVTNYLGVFFIVLGAIIVMVCDTVDGSLASHLWSIGAAGFAAAALVLHKYTADLTLEVIPPVEIFGKVGAVAVVLSAVQMVILGEFSAMTTTTVWNTATSTYFAGYTLAVLLFYAVMCASHHAIEILWFHLSLVLFNVYTALSITWLFQVAVTPVFLGVSGVVVVGVCLYGWQDPFERGFSRKLLDRMGGPEPTMDDAMMDSLVVPIVMALPYSPDHSDYGGESTSMYYLDSARNSYLSNPQPEDEPHMTSSPMVEEIHVNHDVVYTKDYFEGKVIFTMEDVSPASTPRHSLVDIVSYTSNHGTI
ncbi:hypothetical protein H257_00938 [Aphanomyces astaci]|uniref:EamA domain-containing protein n=1 Tax=Aphanomyces astaci TaxID=112090 RepID=W4H5X9_APHAT|nr:hypothetical protein H257_00938 [Aphanomyces astaci]ETV87317.1 hypothetical protein H257_00938 [Aphanomyces astaci]RQM25507.1 hypothetical protein B5M09_005038 [Aphanomyces astaci]|eukprot:XP_009822180.1 hypothetical protein H257_00938 [Aphanomyces astaci]